MRNLYPATLDCEAFKHDLVKTITGERKNTGEEHKVVVLFYVIVSDEQVYIRQRTGRDIWENLHEFVLYEARAPWTLHFQETSFFAGIC